MGKGLGTAMNGYNKSPAQITLTAIEQHDGIHPDNGLPIYALGLTWFQTYVAPMYGIDGDTIDWLPTSSTPKASVSGSTYVSIDATQRALVRQLVKQAMGNRFDFD